MMTKSEAYQYKMSDLIIRLKLRAQIRRQISTRKSVQEGKPDRIADLLDEAANELLQNTQKDAEYFALLSLYDITREYFRFEAESDSTQELIENRMREAMYVVKDLMEHSK